MKCDIIRIPSDRQRPIPPFDANLGFGKCFTDHMFLMEYKNGQWQNARIEPRRNISLDPATMVFHYGQGIFEGLKSYKNGEDLMLFRPEKNMERMNKSAKRLVMPEFDGEFVIECMKKLVLLEKSWMPEKPGYALYLRPTMIATEPFLGVHPSASYLFYVIASPVGAYYANGFNPVDIYVCEKYSRAVRGGIGEAKASGNYAASLYAQMEGKKLGCNQVLWLDALERKYLEEVGAMNVFVKFKNELVTPELVGSILPGVTRNSVATIAKSWGLNVSERRISIDEVIDGIKSGDVTEMFGTGTAAVISPIGRLFYRDQFITVGNGKTGEFSQKMFNFLTRLQLGQEKDTLGFTQKIDPYLLRDAEFKTAKTEDLDRSIFPQ